MAMQAEDDGESKCSVVMTEIRPLPSGIYLRETVGKI